MADERRPAALKDASPALKELANAITACSDSIRVVFERVADVHRCYRNALNVTRAVVDSRPAIAVTIQPLPRLVDMLGEFSQRAMITPPTNSAEVPASLPTFIAVSEKDCVAPLHAVLNQIKLAAKALSDAEDAQSDATAKHGALDAKFSAYQRKGKSAEESQTLPKLQANAEVAEKVRRASYDRWHNAEHDAMVGLTSGLVFSFRCFAEHVGGISGVLNQGLERVFSHCPAPAAAQSQYRGASRSPSPRRSMSRPGQDVIMSPVVRSGALAAEAPPVPAYYKPRQRVSDTTSRPPAPYVNSSVASPRFSSPVRSPAGGSYSLYA